MREDRKVLYATRRSLEAIGNALVYSKVMKVKESLTKLQETLQSIISLTEWQDINRTYTSNERYRATRIDCCIIPEAILV